MQRERRRPDGASILYVGAPHEDGEDIGQKLPDYGDFTVRIVPSANSALEQLDTDASIDCVVSEQDLPDVDGVALLETVRSQYAELPFILFAGSGSEEIASRAISARVTEYLIRDRVENHGAELGRLIEQAIAYHDSRQGIVDPELQITAVLEATPDAMVVLRDDSLVYVNGPATDLFGVDGLSALDDRSLLSFITTESREITANTLDAVQEGSRYVDRIDQSIVSTDGTVTPVKLTAASITWDGEPATLLICRDVTDKKRRISELRRYKQAVESSLDLLAAVDEDLQFLFANRTYCSYHGIDPSTIQGRSLPEVIGESEFETVESGVERALSGEDIRMEITRTFPELGERTLNARLFPLDGSSATVTGVGASMRDITDRKTRENELERYEELVTNLPVGIFRTKPGGSGEVVEANPAAVSIFEAESKADLLGRPVWELFVDTDKRETIQDRLERTGTVEIELRMQTLKGRAFWAKGIATYRHTEDGETFAEGFVLDISSRKERERELETLISNLPGMVYRCRNEAKWPMEMVRGRCDTLTGYSAAEIESGDVNWGEDVIHPEDQEMVWKQVQEAVTRDEPFELTYRITTKSGVQKWVWEQGQAVDPIGADAPRLEGFISDITERKRLREDLVESKERYESLFNSIRDAILVADTDRRIINCNPAFSDIFGYDLEEIEGEPTEILYHDPAEFEEMGEEIERHIDDPEFTYTIEYEKRSGTVFPGETNVFYLRNADDEIEGFIGVIRDISGREDRLQQMKAIDRVLQHNFQNDMNVIEGNALRVKEASSAPISEYASQILETGAKLRSTVTKERDITQFLSDPPDSQSIDLAPALDRTCTLLADRYPDAELSVWCDEDIAVEASIAIGTAIEELVTNAIVHAADGTPTVDIEVEDRSDVVTIRIADSCPEIPEMERKVLTGERELGPLYHGSGLGLWLVNLIVKQSDGVLEFGTNDSTGNVVVIHLPAASE